MKCSDARDLFSDFIDAELDRDGVQMLSAHLRACSECRDWAGAYEKELRPLFGRARVSQAPEGLWAAVKDGLEGRGREKKVIRIDFAARSKLLRIFALAGAAAAMLVGVVLTDMVPGDEGASSGLAVSAAPHAELFAALYSAEENAEDGFGTVVETFLM